MSLFSLSSTRISTLLLEILRLIFGLTVSWFDWSLMKQSVYCFQQIPNWSWLRMRYKHLVSKKKFFLRKIRKWFEMFKNFAKVWMNLCIFLWIIKIWDRTAPSYIVVAQLHKFNTIFKYLRQFMQIYWFFNNTNAYEPIEDILFRSVFDLPDMNFGNFTVFPFCRAKRLILWLIVV